MHHVHRKAPIVIRRLHGRFEGDDLVHAFTSQLDDSYFHAPLERQQHRWLACSRELRRLVQFLGEDGRATCIVCLTERYPYER